MIVISIVLLTFNGEKYLEQCLDSVVEQDTGMDQIEVVIIDDVSSDSTLYILEKYRKRYSQNIRIIPRKVHSSEAKETNRNIGVNEASGEYILFLDQDDWYSQGTFRILLEFVIKYSDLDYIEFRYRNSDMYGRVYEEENLPGKKWGIYQISDEEERKQYARRGILPGATFVWNKLYRKDFLQRYHIIHNDGAQNTGFSDNFFSGLLVLYAKRIAKLNVPLYNYRNYIGSYSHDQKKNSKVQFERCKAGIVFFDECLRRGLHQKNREMVEFIFARTFLVKTFWKFLMNYDPIPYDILGYIQKEMLRRCPDYNYNSIMREREEIKGLLINTA